jgi:hypothetical protein
MKLLLFLLVCAVGGYYGYTYFLNEAPAPAKRLAPPGIYFTKERFSEKTDVGLRALRAGARVTLVRKEGASWIVLNDDKHEFSVPAHILTNDLDERDALLRTIADERDKVRQKAEAEVLVAQQKTGARIDKFRDEIEKLLLRLDELRVSRGRVEEQLKVEVNKSKQSGTSGNPMMGERQARDKLTHLDSEIKIAERQVEDLQLTIRKESLGN